MKIGDGSAASMIVMGGWCFANDARSGMISHCKLASESSPRKLHTTIWCGFKSTLSGGESKVGAVSDETEMRLERGGTRYSIPATEFSYGFPEVYVRFACLKLRATACSD